MELKKPYNYMGEIFIMRFENNYPDNVSISDELKTNSSYINTSPSGYRVGSHRSDNIFDNIYEALDYACSDIITSRCYAVGLCELFDVEYRPGYEYANEFGDENMEAPRVTQTGGVTSITVSSSEPDEDWAVAED